MHILYDTMYFRQVTFISAGYFTYSFLLVKSFASALLSTQWKQNYPHSLKG